MVSAFAMLYEGLRVCCEIQEQKSEVNVGALKLCRKSEGGDVYDRSTRLRPGLVSARSGLNPRIWYPAKEKFSSLSSFTVRTGPSRLAR
jgi:hypothetical protein